MVSFHCHTCNSCSNFVFSFSKVWIGCLLTIPSLCYTIPWLLEIPLPFIGKLWPPSDQVGQKSTICYDFDLNLFALIRRLQCIQNLEHWPSGSWVMTEMVVLPEVVNAGEHKLCNPSFTAPPQFGGPFDARWSWRLHIWLTGCNTASNRHEMRLKAPKFIV
jgi:hypothetical protein